MNYRYIKPYEVNYFIEKDILYIYVRGTCLRSIEGVNKKGRDLDQFVEKTLKETLYNVDGELYTGAFDEFSEKINRIYYPSFTATKTFCELYELIAEEPELAKKYYQFHKKY